MSVQPNLIDYEIAKRLTQARSCSLAENAQGGASLRRRLFSLFLQILRRPVGPAVAGDHPAQWELAPGGSSKSEGADA